MVRHRKRCQNVIHLQQKGHFWTWLQFHLPDPRVDERSEESPAFVDNQTRVTLGVFTLVTRGWAASEFLTRASKFNMTPNRPFWRGRQFFDARVSNVKTLIRTVITPRQRQKISLQLQGWILFSCCLIWFESQDHEQDANEQIRNNPVWFRVELQFSIFAFRSKNETENVETLRKIVPCFSFYLHLAWQENY